MQNFLHLVVLKADLYREAESLPAVLSPLSADPRGTWPHLTKELCIRTEMLSILHRVLSQQPASEDTGDESATPQAQALALIDAWYSDCVKYAQFGADTVNAVRARELCAQKGIS